MAGVYVCVGFFLTASPWASVAFLWIGFEGWLFGGFILLGPPAMCFSEGLCDSLFTLLLYLASWWHLISLAYCYSQQYFPCL